MQRSKKLIIISHCILNQNSVVMPYAKDMSNFSEFINYCLKNNIGIIQLPCPELKHLGLKRWGHLKTQLSYPAYEKLCLKILDEILDDIKEYENNGYEIVGVCGIKGSPTCGVSLTCVGDWCGEVIMYESIESAKQRVKLISEKGIFMEIFSKIVNDKKIPFFDIEDWKKYFD